MTKRKQQLDFSELPKHVPFFSHYLNDIGMTQQELRKKTLLSRGTTTKLVTTGYASKKTILIISKVLKISFEDVKGMLMTQENQAFYNNQ